MVLSIAHRGASAYAPENTMLSFSKAIELGCDMLELDVHLCSTGEVVVIHDHTVDRTTDGKGDVGSLTLEEVRGLDAGFGEKVPTLEEVLELSMGRTGLNVELKGKGTPGPVLGSLKAALDGGWRAQDLIVSSFDPQLLLEFSKGGSGIPMGFLIDRRPDLSIEFALELGASSVHTNHAFTTWEFLYKAHRAGLKVNVWTVNEAKDIQDMIALGVDGVISDRPERVISARKAGLAPSR